MKFVNDMVILKRETGGLAPRVQGHGGGHGKLVGVGDWITARMKAKPDVTLTTWSANFQIITASPFTVSRFGGFCVASG